jgi:hypothetical protein
MILLLRSTTIQLTISKGIAFLSAAIAFIIVPLVYENLMLNQKAPFIVQFGIFVQNGFSGTF